MEKTNLCQWAKEISQITGFSLGRIIYQGEYYSPGNTRNIIIDGWYKEKPAVLKIYDDPRFTDEGPALSAFNRKNKSKLLIAPKVYKFEKTTSHKGWVIMEKLPKGQFFTQPLPKEKRAIFLNLYLEYKKNFSLKPHRDLALAENLSGGEFHSFRISRWFQLANDKELSLKLNGQKSVLEPKEFLPRFNKAIALVRREFDKQKMVWIHGHFKPHEIYKASNKEIYYLTDFAHNKMFPEGYELGFIIWADWIMSANWQMSYIKWRKGIDEWIKEIRKIVPKLKLKDFNQLIKVSLIERVLGTILADICASEKPRKEKLKRISYLYKLLDEFLN